MTAEHIAEKLYSLYKPLNIVHSNKNKKSTAIVYLRYLLQNHSNHR